MANIPPFFRQFRDIEQFARLAESVFKGEEIFLDSSLVRGFNPIAGTVTKVKRNSRKVSLVGYQGTFEVIKKLFYENIRKLEGDISEYAVHESLLTVKNKLAHDCNKILLYTESSAKLTLEELDRFFIFTEKYNLVLASFQLLKWENKKRNRQDQVWDMEAQDEPCLLLDKRIESAPADFLNEQRLWRIKGRIETIKKRLNTILGNISEISERHWITENTSRGKIFSLELEALDKLQIELDDHLGHSVIDTEARSEISSLQEMINGAINNILVLMEDIKASKLSDNKKASVERPVILFSDSKSTLNKERQLTEIEQEVVVMLERFLKEVYKISSTIFSKVRIKSYGDGNVNRQVIRPFLRFTIQHIEKNGLPDSMFSWSELLKIYPKDSSKNGIRMIGALSVYAEKFSTTDDPSEIFSQFINIIEDYANDWNNTRGWVPCELLITNMKAFRDTYKAQNSR